MAPASFTIAAAAVLLVMLLGAVWAIKRMGTLRPPSADLTWLEHIEDLRRRVILSGAAWGAGMLAVFTLRAERTAGGIPYVAPAVQDNMASQVFGVFAGHLVPDGVTLVVTRPIDGFLAEIYLAMGLGFAAAIPVILWQMGGFFMPALKEAERKSLARAFVPALLLFGAGAWFCWTVVLPFALEALYGYGTALGAELLLTVQDLISFSVVLLVVMGLAFQTPLVMYALTRAGVTRSATYLRYWRHALVGILIFAMVATDPTVVSQLLVAAPLVVLYGLGIGAARLAESRRAGSDGP